MTFLSISLARYVSISLLFRNFNLSYHFSRSFRFILSYYLVEDTNGMIKFSIMYMTLSGLVVLSFLCLNIGFFLALCISTVFKAIKLKFKKKNSNKPRDMHLYNLYREIHKYPTEAGSKSNGTISDEDLNTFETQEFV